MYDQTQIGGYLDNDKKILQKGRKERGIILF